jgi:signal peptidase II
MAYFLFKAARKGTLHKGLVVSFSLIVAGAFGNIIDSMFYGIIFNESHGQIATFLPESGGYASFLHGKVVDMFYFPITTIHLPSWFPGYGGEDFLFFSPVFNLADFAISTGVGVFLIYQKHFFKEEKQVKTEEQAMSGDI